MTGRVWNIMQDQRGASMPPAVPNLPESLTLGPTGWPELQPWDHHNQTLLSNTHPPDWINPTAEGRYNLVVIGAGTAGLVAAAGAAGLGAKVALIERRLMGGDCLNVGCVPSKALIRSARLLAELRGAERFGVRVPPGTEVDFPAMMERMRGIRAAISPHDSAARFRDLGVDVFLGSARFLSRDSVDVGGQTLTFSRACISTGARASAPPIPGLQEAGYLTNETVFSLTELPRRLAVIGAGPIGCELAQTFARFGSEVYLIEAMDRVLPNEDPEASEIVRAALLRDGVRLMCCGKNVRITRTEEGKQFSVDSDDAHYDLTVDEILVGAGRRPNVEALGLESAGVQYGAQGIEVNDFLQTTNPHIYAAGDVCSRYKFTHAADAMARIVIQNALFFGRKRAGALTIPWCTYTDPEVAQVGLTPHGAQQRGIEIDTYKVELSRVDRALLDGETEGFLKVHVRRGTGTILGATLVARHAGEMISEITLAMATGAGLGTIAGVIHPYPTQAEIIKRAADAYNRTRLTPRIKHWFEWLLSWRR
jgi:pyruvate/2-oxoglutarate dehydrogenase complex dihydrolipoamide dehydrogenase (E3) component